MSRHPIDPEDSGLEVETPEQRQTSYSDRGLQPAPLVVPYYSLILVACLVLVFIGQVAVDGIDTTLMGGERSASIAGFDKPVFVAGQYWRILTGAALHGGAVHLFFNGYALYVLGKLIETLSNRAHLAIVFLLSAVGGNLLSLWAMPEGLSVGASGGIVGFLGYLAVYGYRRRALLTAAFLKGMLFNIGFLALYGVALYRVIDNFGHLGGLLTGAVYGFFQISGDIYRDPRAAHPVTEIFGLVALGIFIATALFSTSVLLNLV